MAKYTDKYREVSGPGRDGPLQEQRGGQTQTCGRHAGPDLGPDSELFHLVLWRLGPGLAFLLASAIAVPCYSSERGFGGGGRRGP